MDFVNICRKALYFRGSLSICPAYAGVILGHTGVVDEVPLICPAYAGVILQSYQFLHIAGDLSRVCGGDPTVFKI